MPGVIAGVAAGAAGVGLVAGGMMYASVWPTSQIFGRTLIAGSDPGEIALTFDDGPNDAATPELLEVLARHGVRATFFAMGKLCAAAAGDSRARWWRRGICWAITR